MQCFSETGDRSQVFWMLQDQKHALLKAAQEKAIVALSQDATQACAESAGDGLTCLSNTHVNFGEK